MLRSVIEEVLLFVLPFCIFAGYLLVQRRNPFDVEHWTGRVFWLSVAGLMLGIATFAYTGWVAPRNQGAYDPPHMENGRLVPGRFK